MKRQSHAKIKRQIRKLEKRMEHADNLLRDDIVEKLQHEIKILELALGNMVYPYYV